MISTKTAAEIISDLNASDETESIEAKAIANGEVGKSFYETVSAFCNEPALGGGTIICGVSVEQGLWPLYKATGLSDPDKICRDIGTACSTIFNAPVRVKITTEVVDGQTVIKVDVPEAGKASKPVFL